MNTKKGLVILLIMFIVLMGLSGWYYFFGRDALMVTPPVSAPDDIVEEVPGDENIIEDEKEGEKVITGEEGEFVPNDGIVIDEEESVDDLPVDDTVDVRRKMLEELRKKSQEVVTEEVQASRDEAMQKMLEEAAAKVQSEEVEDTSTDDRMSALEAMRKEIEDKASSDESQE